MPKRRAQRPPSGSARDDARPPGLGGLGSHWRRDGSPKVSYMSQAEALSIAEERSRETGLHLEVYRCTVCSAWHMGNPPGRDD